MLFVVFIVILLVTSWWLLFNFRVFKVERGSEIYKQLEDLKIDEKTISSLSHSDRDWFLNNKRLCVGYVEGDKEINSFSNTNILCNPMNTVCPFNKPQSVLLKEAIDNGGEHPNCPLVY